MNNQLSNRIIIGLILFTLFINPVEAGWYKGNTHVHSTASDGLNSSAQVATWYSTHGYDFLMLSDHDIVTDLSVYNTTSFLTINGEEKTGASGHIELINVSLHQLGNDQSIVNNISGYGLAVLAHPDLVSVYWLDSRMTILNAYNGIEVYNKNVAQVSFQRWDTLLMQGKHVFAYAVDDSHNVNTTSGYGWIVVNSSNLGLQNIMTSLQSGDFYSLIL